MSTNEMARALDAVAIACGEAKRAPQDAVKEHAKGKARKALGKEKGKRKSRNVPMGEAELLAKYPHVVAGSLRRGKGTTKMSCRASLKCGHEETVFTSDLFQVKRCSRKECAKKAL